MDPQQDADPGMAGGYGEEGFADALLSGGVLGAPANQDGEAPDTAASASAGRPERAHPVDESTAATAHGQDGEDVRNSVAGYLDYLSQLARQLNVPDPVEEYFSPVVGRWSDMHAEAEKWRAAAKAAVSSAERLTGPLGGLDSVWQGPDADAFIQYMERYGRAGQDAGDAMNAMADVLDKTADGIREIVTEMASTLADTAEASSQAGALPAQGEQLLRQGVQQAQGPVREMFESVRQVLESFVRLCEGVDGGAAFDKVKLPHEFPQDRFVLPSDMPEVADGPQPGNDTGPTDSSTHGAGSSGGGGAAGAGTGAGTGAVGAGGGAAGGFGSAGAGSQLQPGAVTGAQPGAAAAAGAPATSAAAGGAAAGDGGGVRGGGMMPMGMGAGGGQGGDEEHKSKTHLVGDAAELFGAPEKTAPPVIGED